MTRLRALPLTVVLALAACDAGVPSEADDIEGAWTFASVVSQDLVTVSKTQTVVDLSRAPEGSLQMSGEESGALRYLSSFYRYGASSTLWLASYDPYSGTYPAVRHTLMLADDGATKTAALRMESDVEVREYQASGADVFSRDGARYAVDTDVPSWDGEGAPVAHLAGTFTLGNRAITAGERTVMSEYRYDFEPYNTVRYVFERGGDLKIQEVSGNRTVEREGTWTRTGDRLRVSSMEGDALVTYEYAVRREGGALLLASDRSAYECTAECLRYTEEAYGIEPGTLRSARTEEVLRLTPYAGGRASAQAGPSPQAASWLPAPLSARVRVAPQPRP